MREKSDKHDGAVQAADGGKKQGLFGRIFRKLDDSMKQKAEEKSQQGSCCGGSDGKGGKCC